MEYILVALVIAFFFLGLSLFFVARKNKSAINDETIEILRKSINETTQNSVKNMGDLLITSLGTTTTQLENRFKTFETVNEQKLENMRLTMEKKLSSIQEDNNKRLEDMRKTVDEKLQKTLEDKMNQSFKIVSERLEAVYRGLGEMQNLANGVGDLKKVLSNVKTRGILGEIQLGAILEEILSHEQYEVNIATVPNSKNVVEYAIKMPLDDDSFVYLPIDSKFPGDTYALLQDAYESGNPDLVKEAVSKLSSSIKLFAKDIHEKYVEVPYTTEFAIMFLPFEGLYAEVVNRGLVEVLQRDYKINVAGPSTMAALLNSLQMGFKTVAIQKRSLEAWQILSAVKSEFDNFAKVLENTQNRLNQANSELDKLVGVRTRAIIRKLKNVEKLDNPADVELILPSDDAE